MNILIVGACNTSARIATTLAVEKIEVHVIDSCSERLKLFEDIKNVKTIKVDYVNREALLCMKLDIYQSFLALTQDDGQNIVLASIAKEVGIPLVLAEIHCTETYMEMNPIKKKLGIDFVINNEIETAKIIKTIINRNKLSKIDSFALGKIQTFIYLVEEGNSFADVEIKNLKGVEELLVVAILRGAKVLIPNGDTKVLSGDKLYFMGLSHSIEKFNSEHYEFFEDKSTKSIVFIGHSKIVEEVVLRLNLKEYDIKIISGSKDRAKELRNKIPEVLVSYGDLKKLENIEFENILEQDYVLVSTEKEEDNIALSLYLKQKGVNNIILTVENPLYSRIFDEIDISACLNSAYILANRIIRKIRADRDLSVYIMFGGLAEVVEITLLQDVPLLNKEIKDLGLSKGIIIGGVIKPWGEVLIPHGNTILEKGDRIVVFCLNEKREELIKFIDPKRTKGFFSEVINLY